jgi:predicted metal-dependent HD superfamily phosphohydrolase
MPSADASRDRLRRRWQADMMDLGAASALFDDLCARYSEPHRHYHTLIHLDALFTALEPHALRHKQAVHFAAWYHDVIYDTARSDNEERSAALARDALGQLGFADIARVEHMILATKSHTAPPADEDEALFLDADFSILGAPPARYAAYVAEVRAEYGWLPDEGWRAGRIAFLMKTSEAARLFHTDAFENRLGAQARANIAWERAQLT